MMMQHIRSVIGSRAVALILGGGRGSRLYPLTKSRSKPAVSVGGKYRLIDIPISNCINSGISMIYVLTQFLSAGLNRHITRTYRFDSFGHRFVEILAAEQSPTNFDYAQGTADAVRQCVRYLEGLEADYVFILSGDQLFRIDLSAMLQHHIDAGADVTLSCLRIPERDASKSGIVKTDKQGRITDFFEKTESASVWERFRVAGPTKEGKTLLGSMGLYVFNKKVLLDVLTASNEHDFGKGIFPHIIKTHTVSTYEFNGYWEDIGTIASYFDASMRLTDEDPPFSFYDAAMPIYTHHRSLPPPKLFGCFTDKAILCEGTIVHQSTIRSSIIGIRTHIGTGCDIDQAIIMGNDTMPANVSWHNAHFGIQAGTKIRRAIIDKNVVIGRGVRISGSTDEQLHVRNDDAAPFHIINGIVVIPRGTVIPDNTVIHAGDFTHAGSIRAET